MNITVSAGGVSAVTDASGAFTLPATLTGTQRAVLSGPQIISRALVLSSAMDAFRTDTFDLAFYRQFARNGFEQPGALQPIHRWTVAPRLYLRTIDEAGVPIDAVTLNTVETAMREVIGTWSGDHFGFASVERGTETRQGMSGYLTVRWLNPKPDAFCGQAQVGVDGGVIDFNYLDTACACNGSAMRPRTARHELGHALGYWHTDRASDLMFGVGSVCDQQPSSRETQYAHYVYARPVGSTDPDNDPGLAAARVTGAPVVVD